MSGPWTHTFCDECWKARHADREPVRVKYLARKSCCGCGKQTTSGIWVREDPQALACRGRGHTAAAKHERIPEVEWEWFGRAGHLCVGNFCRFHLATKVGNIWISTVGAYFPEEGVREILANIRGWELEGKGDTRRASWCKQHPHGGYEEIGAGSEDEPALYETMAFNISGGVCKCGCGMPEFDPCEIDLVRYSDQQDARAGHLAMCRAFADNQDRAWEDES
ncbi:MAG: hypothetical protein ACE5F1_00985 [Planctomycetota bacterium]